MPRDQRVLHRQCRDLALYFRTAWTDEEIESLAPGGSAIIMSGKGSRRREPRFCGAVHARVDAFPLHVRLYALPALHALPAELRLAVYYVLLKGCTRRDAAAMMGRSERTVFNWLRQALATIARQLWDDSGQQRLPDGRG